MARLNSIGIVECVGMASALECADAAVKSANVKLLGYELSKGGGMVTIKLMGDVAAVQSAVAAGAAACERIGEVAAKIVIARPHKDLDKIIYSKETVLAYPPEKADTAIQETTDSTPAGNVPVDEPPAQEPPQEVEDADLAEPEEEPEEATPQGEATCNLCGDPACPRQKGEPRIDCIHYRDDESDE